MHLAWEGYCKTRGYKYGELAGCDGKECWFTQKVEYFKKDEEEHFCHSCWEDRTGEECYCRSCLMGEIDINSSEEEWERLEKQATFRGDPEYKKELRELEKKWESKYKIEWTARKYEVKRIK